jgi:hypothetical protein
MLEIIYLQRCAFTKQLPKYLKSLLERSPDLEDTVDDYDQTNWIQDPERKIPRTVTKNTESVCGGGIYWRGVNCTEVYTTYEIGSGMLPRDTRRRGKCDARKGGVEPDADDASYAGMPNPNTIKK